MPSPDSRQEVAQHRLDNGLRVVLHRDLALPLVAVNLWYHVGSRNERRGLTGLAHLFEHMLFQGSQHVDENEHFRYVQQVGGVANGSTWYDRTNYYETLPAQHLELGLWLESDRMGFLLPALTEEKLENQRSVVMNERRQRVDNQPYGRASERLFELLYPPEHPYHWPVIGYMDDIASASLDDVRSFFETFYTPNNAVLTLAGDFEPAAALDSVERYFADLEPGPAVDHSFPAPPLGLRARPSEVLEDRVGLPRIYDAFCVPGIGSSDWYAATLLATILGDGKASRLYRDLVYERQIAQSAVAYVLATEACATFAVVVTGKPSVSVEELRERTSVLLSGLVGEPPREQERERALNSLLTAHFNDLQSLDHRADALSMATTYLDDPEAVWSEPERFRAVSLDDLVACADRYLSAETAASVSVVPGEHR